MICPSCGADTAYGDPCPKDPDACPIAERSRRQWAKTLSFPARYGSKQPSRPETETVGTHTGRMKASRPNLSQIA